MSKRFKWAIVRALEAGAERISDDACIEMIWTGRQSVLSYWSDVTYGWYDFAGSEMLPWVDIDLTGAASRPDQVVRAFAAVRAQLGGHGHDPLAGFDGAIVLIHPGLTTNGGAAIGLELPTALIGVMTGNHTFMCHEIGHALGFEHCWGLPSAAPGSTPASLVSYEYGSPYDVMCSSRWGHRVPQTEHDPTPAFVGTPVPGWPNPDAHSMGPSVSRANLHRWHPEALGIRAAERPFPGPGEVGGVQLVPAGAPSDTALLILHPPGEPASGVGRVYVEYRESYGWDRGLDTFGSALERVGVVVHDIVDVPGVGPRVWYRGSILNGSADADLAVEGHPLVITVDRFSDVGGRLRAEISYRQTGEKRVTIIPFNQADGIVGGSVTREDRTPCGDTVGFGSWSTLSTCQYRATTVGLGGSGGSVGPGPIGAPEPSISWTVGGTQLPVGEGSIDIEFDDTTYPLDYKVEAVSNELTLTSGGGLRYGTDIVVTATEPGGGASVSASARFEALGYYDGYTPEDQVKIAVCLPPIDQPGLEPPRPPMHLERPPDLRFPGELADWRERALAAVARATGLDDETRERVTRLVEMQAPQ